MRLLVFDLEANGLLRESDEVYCIFGKEIGRTPIYGFWNNNSVIKSQFDHELSTKKLLTFFSSFDTIIGHNIIGYDIPMIKRFFDINLYSLFPLEKIVDTYVWSKVLNPDREMPKGCPTTITPSLHLRSLGHKTKRIGPHGLESWGYRVSIKKPSIDSWHHFKPSILDRCKEDVLINEKTYLELIKEAAL